MDEFNPLDTIDEFIHSIYDTINGVVNSLRSYVNNAIRDVQRRISDAIAGVYDNLRDWLSNLLSSIASALSSVYNAIANWLGGVLSSLADALDQVYQDVTSILNGVINSVAIWLNNVYNTVQEAIKTAIDTARDWIVNAYNNVKTALENTINTVGNWISKAYQDVSEWVKNAYNNVGAWLEKAYNNVSAWLTVTIDKVADWLREQYERVTAEAERVVGILENAVRDLIDSYLKPLKEGISTYNTQISEPANKSLNSLVGLLVDNPETPPSVSNLLQFVQNIPLIGKSILFIALLSTLIGNSVTSVTTPHYEKMVQWVNTQLRPALISPTEAVAAVRRGFLEAGPFFNTMRRLGYTDDDIQVLLQLYDSYLSVDQYISLYRRGKISYKDFVLYLGKVGIKESEVENLLTATEYIPNISDLIEMAVREVFSPEQREALDLDADFPEAFATYAAQQGMSEEWARAYWAAHWRLPSAEQGYEMMHRGVISRDELKMLLRALDYAPVWRDRLMAISYAPYTRVDVRRLYAKGILTEEEVYKNYLHLGYDPEHAKALTEFTITQEAKEEKAVQKPDRDLTRSQIEKAYKKRIIDYDTAKSLLQSIGYDESESDFCLLMIDYDTAIEKRDRAIERIKKRYINYDYDDITAAAKLAEIGLSDKEVQDTLEDFKYTIDTTRKVPPLSDLKKFYGEKLITEDEFILEVKRRGYAEKWAQCYAKLSRKTEITG